MLFVYIPGVFSLVASDVSVESSASDLNFFSGTCSVLWWAGALYFLSANKHKRKPTKQAHSENKIF